LNITQLRQATEGENIMDFLQKFNEFIEKS
jgi:hypothetical protein